VVSCSSSTVLVWGRQGPITAVYYVEPECDDPTDSGFGLLREDAPLEPDGSTPRKLLCLDCALDSWPGIGRALDLARERGSADLEAGE
jgi:hypothetical protein